MMATVLSTGTELTRGELVNTNASFLSEQLTQLGFQVVEGLTVDDDEARIAEAIDRLASRVQVVVCTGGLGPTTDDLTAAAAAKALRVGLVRDALRFAPELPAGSPIGPRVTTVRGFRTRGGPAPRGGPLDCDDAIVLPTDVLAACGGGPYRAVELAADRSGEDCVHAFVGPGSASG